MIIYDAKDMIVGRLATKVAKDALLGNDVAVVNCKDAVISGNGVRIMQRYKRYYDRGNPAAGPFIKRQSHMLVKRIIRGMLPYDRGNGKEAFKRIKCYVTVPASLQEKMSTFVKLESASVEKLTLRKYTTIGRVAAYLGGKQ